MEGQARADPADERAQPEMAAGKIQRFESGADDGLLQSHSQPPCFRQQWPHFLAEPLSRSPAPVPASVESRLAGRRLARSLKVSTADLRLDCPFAPRPLAAPSRESRDRRTT